MKRVAIFYQLLFVSFLLIAMAETHANPIVVSMIKAEKTGNKTQIPPPIERGEWEPLPWYYEIKVEWYAAGFPNPGSIPALDLYRRNSPGAYPNGSIVAYDVQHYTYQSYIDHLCHPVPCIRYKGLYRHYDWAIEGYTWYYMAEDASNEVSVEVL